jgi:CubicO group peptidase (beta-lactamase class C family)
MKRLIYYTLFLASYYFGHSQTKLFRTYEKTNTISGTTIENQVDSIVNNAINLKAFPGAQLLVVKNHEIIFHKTYGFHTYDSIIKVQHSNVYDLASVTKILGPLLPIMKLYEDGKLDLDIPFSTYWKPWRQVKNKKSLTLRELLAHQSGLEPYIPFIKDVLKKQQLNDRFIRSK